MGRGTVRSMVEGPLRHAFGAPPPHELRSQGGASMSWRVSLDCTKAEAEALPDASDLFPDADSPPVLVADEPDASQPDQWRIHAYFDRQPGWDELKLLEGLAADGDPVLEKLDESTDWVTVSQA